MWQISCELSVKFEKQMNILLNKQEKCNKLISYLNRITIKIIQKICY